MGEITIRHVHKKKLVLILTITNVPAGNFMKSRILASIPKVEQPER